MVDRFTSLRPRPAAQSLPAVPVLGSEKWQYFRPVVVVPDFLVIAVDAPGLSGELDIAAGGCLLNAVTLHCCFVLFFCCSDDGEGVSVTHPHFGLPMLNIFFFCSNFVVFSCSLTLPTTWSPVCAFLTVACTTHCLYLP